MELDKVIRKRKSVRNFSDKKPDWRDILECIDNARLVPLAGNNSILRYVVVNDKEKIQKLSETAQQDFINQSSYLVVVCSKPGRTKTGYKERGEIYVRQQAGASIQNLLLSLENKGLASCWVGHFAEEQVKSILQIPEEIYVEAILPIGYETSIKHKKSSSKNKAELDKILYFNKWKEKRMKPLKGIKSA
ncbi:MAG: nitroreductase family protein [Nanoarchaeota archaeon]